MKNMKRWTFPLVLHVFGYCFLVNGLDNQTLICSQDLITLQRDCVLFETKSQRVDDTLEYCNSTQASLVVIQSHASDISLADYLRNIFNGLRNDWNERFTKENGHWTTFDGEPLQMKIELLTNGDTVHGLDHECEVLRSGNTYWYLAGFRCPTRNPDICKYLTAVSRPSTTSTTLLLSAAPVTVPSSETPPTSQESEIVELTDGGVTLDVTVHEITSQTYSTKPQPPISSVSTFDVEMGASGDEEIEEEEDGLKPEDNKNDTIAEKDGGIRDVTVGEMPKEIGVLRDQKAHLQVVHLWNGTMDAHICLEHDFLITCGWEMDITFSTLLSSIEIWNSTIRSMVVTPDWGTRVTVNSRIWADNHRSGDCTRFIAFYNGMESPDVKARFTRVCQGGHFTDVPQNVEDVDYDVFIKISWSQWTVARICLYHTAKITCGFDAEIVFSPPVMKLEMESMILVGAEESPDEIRYQLTNLRRTSTRPNNRSCHNFHVFYEENKIPTVIKGRLTRTCDKGLFIINPN